MRHPAGGPAAQSHADADPSQVMDHALDTACMRVTPGMRKWRFADFEFPFREVVDLWYSGGSGRPLLKHPSDGNHVEPPSRRRVQRAHPFDCGADLTRPNEHKSATGPSQEHGPIEVLSSGDINYDSFGLVPVANLSANLRHFHEPIAVQ